MRDAFLLFVYGTLKRNERAHARFCKGAAFVAPGTVRGVLHLHPDGYPILVVPDADVRALGTPDLVADTSLIGLADDDLPVASPPGRWRAIRGEIFAFSDPSTSIAAIDEYEGVSASAAATYRRVLLPVAGTPLVRRAWGYAAAPGASLAGIPPLEADSWP